MTQTTQNQKNILLLEDDYILAIDAEESIESETNFRTELATTVDRALDILKNKLIDGAIIDFNIGQHNSVAVVRYLKTLKIPFAVVSGTEIRVLKQNLDEDVVIWTKPVDYHRVACSLF